MLMQRRSCCAACADFVEVVCRHARICETMPCVVLLGCWSAFMAIVVVLGGLGQVACNCLHVGVATIRAAKGAPAVLVSREFALGRELITDR